MSKNKSKSVSEPSTALATVPSVSKSDLAAAAVNAPPLASAGAMTLTPGAFDSLGGEIYAGLNILKLQPGEAAGPFILIDITENVEIEKPGRKAKNATPSLVTKYGAEHLAFRGRRVEMPIAASFLGKCVDSKLSVGDIFALRRGENYTDRVYKQSCQSYELRVLARKGDAADKFRVNYASNAA